MAHNGYRVIDSDMHILEPPNLWRSKYVPENLWDEMPVFAGARRGGLGMKGSDGTWWGRNQLAVSAVAKGRKSKEFTERQKMLAAFDERDWGPDVQLEVMDLEGIDIAVLYPSRGLFALTVKDLHPDLGQAIAHGYNSWLYDFCQKDPQRLRAAAMVSPFDIDSAVKEVERAVHDLGFNSIFMRPNLAGGRNWYDPYYDPLWNACESLNVPIAFHEGAGCGLPYVGEQFGNNLLMAHVFSHPVEQMLSVGAMCMGGVLARFPKLNVAFLEGCCSWLPFLLWRMDDHWERLGEAFCPDLTMAPSKYFQRQCYVHLESDEQPALALVEDFKNNLMFASDFPHDDSHYPESVAVFNKLPMESDSRKLILWDNPAKLYSL